MPKPSVAVWALVASFALLATCTDPTVPPQSTNRCNQDADCKVGYTCQGGACSLVMTVDASADAGTGADAGADAGVSTDAGAVADAGAGAMDAGVNTGGTKTTGQACDFASDCVSGFCVQTNTLGRVCSVACASDCPVGWGCRVVDIGGGNYAQVCFPAGDVYCIRCSTSPSCGSGGDQCTNIGGATYCTQSCATKACVAGYECRDIAIAADAGIDAGTTKQCVPADGGLCPGCVDGDGDGYGIGAGCLGTDSYDGGSCDDDATRNPGQAEVCDNRDNNCNGSIDEGFNLQTSSAHCGGCNKACQTNIGTSATSCLAGICQPTCANGYFDCDGNPSNGCETNLASVTFCNIACNGNDAICPTGFFCSGGTTCEKKRTTGSSCTGGNECATGYCYDGKCCDKNCSGACQSCATGACLPYAVGTDPEAECAAADAGTCGFTGLCDGNSACQYYAAGTECVAQSCATGVQSNARTCNGAGTCQTGTQVNCNGYECSGTTCRTSCSNDTHCVTATHQCKSNICKKRAGEACGAGTECASGACCGSVCRDTQTDTSYCGNCTTACTNANGTTSCVAGVCTPVCVGLYKSCDSNVVNGCETAVNTTTNCGTCGTACDLANASESCSTGSCLISSCNSGYKNCDGVNSNGCERQNSGYSNSAPGESIGTWNSDAYSGFLCPEVACTPVAQRTGYQGRYFTIYAREDSTCCAYLGMEFDLAVPSGVDFDLYVTQGSPGGSFSCQYWTGSAWASGCSAVRGSGLTDKIRVLANDDCGGADNNFTVNVEVRWLSGSSCTPWTLDFLTNRCAG